MKSNTHLTIANIIIVALIVLVAAGAVWAFTKPSQSSNVIHSSTLQTPASTPHSTPVGQITNFDQCAAAGNPVMQTAPETCSANGHTYTKQ